MSNSCRWEQQIQTHIDTQKQLQQSEIRLIWLQFPWTWGEIHLPCLSSRNLLQYLGARNGSCYATFALGERHPAALRFIGRSRKLLGLDGLQVGNGDFLMVFMLCFYTFGGWNGRNQQTESQSVVFQPDLLRCKPILITLKVYFVQTKKKLWAGIVRMCMWYTMHGVFIGVCVCVCVWCWCCPAGNIICLFFAFLVQGTQFRSPSPDEEPPFLLKPTGAFHILYLISSGLKDRVKRACAEGHAESKSHYLFFSGKARESAQ